MKIAGTNTIQFPVDQVWDALLDPAVLVRTIPGCERLETKGDRVTDLHLWQVGPGHRAAVISVVSDDPLPPATYKRRLKGLRGLSHVTIEVELCQDAPSPSLPRI